MAITRAQQARQLLEKGGRIGFKGGADMGTVDAKDSRGNVTRAATSKSVNISPSGSVTTSRDDPTPPQQRIGGEYYDVIPDNKTIRNIAENIEKVERNLRKKDFINTTRKPINTPFPLVNAGINFLGNILPKIENFLRKMLQITNMVMN